MASTLVIAFGRFNPPTIGHGELFDHLLARARATSGKVVLFVSNTVDHPNNPLSHAEKSALIRQSFPAITIGPTTVKTPYEALTWADQNKASSVILVVGRDRLDEFKRMAENWKRADGKESTTKVTVEDSGARTKGISGTDARELARKGDFASFKKIALPRLPDSAIKRTITTIQNGLREMANYTEFDILLEADDKEDKPSAEDAKKEIAALKDRLATLEKVVGDDGEDDTVEVDAADDSEDDSKDDKETKSDKKSAPPKSSEKKDDEDGEKKSFPALSRDKKEDNDGESDSKSSAPKGKSTDKKEDSGKPDKKPASFGKSASDDNEDNPDDTIEVDAPEDEENPNAKEKVTGEDSASSSAENDGESDKPKEGNPFGNSSKEDTGDIEVDAPVDEDGEPLDEDPPDPADRVDSDRPDNQSKVALHPPQRLLFTMGQRYTPPEVPEEDDEEDDEEKDTGKAPFGGKEKEDDSDIEEADIEDDDGEEDIEDDAEIEVDAPEDEDTDEDEDDEDAKKKKDERFKNAK